MRLVVRQQVSAGEWQVGEVDGVPAGGLRLLWSDEEIWQQDHAFTGLGIGAQLLEWAQQQVRAAGAPALRLDCVESNAALRKYYAGLGFREVGRRDFDGPWFAATLLEKVFCPEPADPGAGAVPVQSAP